MMDLISKAKAALAAIEPKVAMLISAAPFMMGLLLGYLLRGPISLLLGLVRLILKI